MTILRGQARCNECGYIGPRDDFGKKIRCPECGKQNVEINPEVVEIRTLDQFGKVVP